ncbi:hypothetical protein Pmani_014070 [Petrolisthes manimaculis]|uniref:Tyrosine-protein kinase BAZ1B n=1 Tax=Petrolisthes manimaculis TaxID=1843537 RepID=A0AAE1PX22_9EUCA|nr:hypothetical protein Pmani_014070 [Petrolisthes manimaculis]
MPLLQGQPFRLTKPPDNLKPGAEVYTIQHTGEKFVNKSDYEDRLALYSQSIWSCQCSGKSGLTHQEAWTSEAKVRILLSSSFPEVLLAPILGSIHHSTLPLDQLVETAFNLCHTRFHPGEELTMLGLQPRQVRVIKSKENPSVIPKSENGSKMKPLDPRTGPIFNGCASPVGGGEGGEVPQINGTSNGTGEASPPPSNNNSGGKGKEKEDSSSGRKKAPPPLPLLYEVQVIGEDRIEKDVPARLLQRTYRIPPKEHFRSLVRASAMRQRSSSYTPWLVSEDLVRQYKVPSKLASIFISPKSATGSRKRKADGGIDKRFKKVKADKMDSPSQAIDEGKVLKVTDKPPKKTRAKRDPNTPKKKPGPKPGSKRAPKVQLSPVKAPKTLTKTEGSDSDDNVSLAVLANRQAKTENGTYSTSPQKLNNAVTPVTPNKKREVVKPSPVFPNVHKMKQATLFDLKMSPKKSVAGSPGRKPGRRPTAEGVMRSPTMKSVMTHFNRQDNDKRRLVQAMKVASKKLSVAQIEVIPVPDVRDSLMKMYQRKMNRQQMALMQPQEREKFKKDEIKRARKEAKLKKEDKLLHHLKPLPPPQVVPTPEEIPNSLFGDIAMVVEFIECYQDLIKPDKKITVSHSQLSQALAAGPKGFKFVAEIICLLLHIIITDDSVSKVKELGIKLSALPIHVETATELVRICFSRLDCQDGANSDDNTEEGEERSELPEAVLHKLESSDLHELQPQEVLEILKALCYRVMCSDVTVEHMEVVLEKAGVLSKQERQQRKDDIKAKKMPLLLKSGKKKGRPSKNASITRFLNQKEKKDETSGKNTEIDKNLNDIKEKTICKKQDTIKEEVKREEHIQETETVKVETMEEEKRKEKESVKMEVENLEEYSLVLSRSRRKRRTPQEQLEEKQKKEEEINKKREEKMEKLHQEQVEKECQTLLMRKDLMLRLRPLGVDRNHDRYWLFNYTTPGLYVEKGWVDAHSTYNTQGPISTSSVHHHNNNAQDSDSDDVPLAAIKQELITSPKKEIPPPWPVPLTELEKTQTFPPVGQNMWFYYNTMEQVKKVIGALNAQGLRESKLKSTLIKVKDKFEGNFAKQWPPLENLEDGSLQLTEALKADIIQIEKELSEGIMGAVPNIEEWEKKAEKATSVQELGECMVEAQQYMNKKFLKGILQPSKTVVLIHQDNPEESELVDGPQVHHWRESVLNCQTFSRMHLLVGMFDTCIKWEKSAAAKKCKVCRQQGSSEHPLAICEKCGVSYHWTCLRPPIREDPPGGFLCSICAPANRKDRQDRRVSRPRNQDYDEGEDEKEKFCRVCTKGLGLIFCFKCPAAYHSECHNPPLQTRARKDWECVDCTKKSKKRTCKWSQSSRSSKITMITDTRRVSRSLYKEEDSESETSSDGLKKEGKRASERSRRQTRQQENAEESPPERKMRPRRTLRQLSNKRSRDVSEDEEEEDEEFCAHTSARKGTGQPARKNQGRATRRMKSYRVESSEEEEEDEKQDEEEEEEEMEELEEEEEDNDEQDEVDDDDDEPVCSPCSYCGIGGGAGPVLQPCLTCEATFHPDCARKAHPSQSDKAYQCSECQE